MAKPKIKTVSRSQMISTIKRRLKKEYDMEVSADAIKNILSIEEDEVYMIIAQNQKFNYYWGSVYGISKPPQRVGGSATETRTVKNNHGWSFWKVAGVPKIIWSKPSRIYDVEPPGVYFELPENRYTTKAREYRHDAGLPEIPEYANLTEEKILELCEKADKIAFDKLSWVEKKKIVRHKYNDRYNKAIQMYWEKYNELPMGCIDREYKGKQKDTVDHCRMIWLKDDMLPEEKLDIALHLKDMAITRETIDKHPELDEMIEEYRKEVKEQGRIEIPHVVRYDENYYKSKFAIANEYRLQDEHYVIQTSKEKQAAIDKEVREFFEKLEQENCELEKGED